MLWIMICSDMATGKMKPQGAGTMVENQLSFTATTKKEAEMINFRRRRSSLSAGASKSGSADWARTRNKSTGLATKATVNWFHAKRARNYEIGGRALSRTRRNSPLHRPKKPQGPFRILREHRSRVLNFRKTRARIRGGSIIPSERAIAMLPLTFTRT